MDKITVIPLLSVVFYSFITLYKMGCLANVTFLLNPLTATIFTTVFGNRGEITPSLSHVLVQRLYNAAFDSILIKKFMMMMTMSY